MHHKPRQFRPSLSLSFFFFLFLRTLPTSLHLECCATPFMHLFQRRMHIATHPFSTHHTFSILSVLPQCDSAMIVFSLFIHSLLHCCSTSSCNEIIPLFSDSIRISESADRSVSRDASLAINRYLHRFHQENGLLITR